MPRRTCPGSARRCVRHYVSLGECRWSRCSCFDVGAAALKRPFSVQRAQPREVVSLAVFKYDRDTCRKVPMSERFILIPGRTSKQGCGVSEGKFDEGYQRE